MDTILNSLRKDNLIDEETVIRIEEAEKSKLFSLFWYLKSLLYLGVTMVATGFGVLVYKNIDTIGHLTIVVLIGLISFGCFFYCFKKGMPFSSRKTEAPGIGFDYVLLLGCLMFLTFLAYLQWQYRIFGNQFGMATFIPACILLLTAYRFDHLGVLTMGIAMFSSWMGLTTTPLDILEGNNFSSPVIIYTGIGLAVLFCICGYFHTKQDFKKHFTFTYFNFAAHLAGISCVAGLFAFPFWIIWIALLATVVFAIHRYAMNEKSFYMLLVSILYGYFGAGYIFSLLADILPEVLSIYLGFGGFIATSVYLIRYLKQTRKSFNADDSL